MKKNIILLLILLLLPFNIYAQSKNEIVYTIMDIEGKTKNVNVVNHIYGTKTATTTDYTTLKNILSIGSKDKFTFNNNTLIWENSKKDIYYKGTTDKTLPIKTTIKYYLDGEELNPKELLNKSGKVKIVITFKNSDAHVFNINGQKEILYTPFVITLGSIINDKNVSNVNVTNGKVINTGNKNIIASVAAPGLYESMMLDSLIDLNHIVITYDTKKYKNNTYYLIATPKLLDNTDLSVFDKLDEVYNKVDLLNEKMDEIEKGSNTLLNELEKKIYNMSSLSYKTLDDNTLNKIKELAIKSVNDSTKASEEQIKNKVVTILDSNENLKPENVSFATLQTLAGTNEKAESILSFTKKCDNTIINNLKNELLSHTSANDDGIIHMARALGLITNATPAIYYETIAETLALNIIESCDAYVTAYTVSLNELNALKLLLPSIVYDNIYSSSSLVASNVSVSVAQNVASSFTKETINSLNYLKDNIKLLNDGINKYNSEGIKSITNYKNEIKCSTERVKSLVNLSIAYNGFTANNSDTTTFISVIK